MVTRYNSHGYNGGLMATTEQIQSTIDYYVDLLIFQYLSKDKARATIANLSAAGIVELVPLDVRDAFDLETAIGPQLDVLGQYIGFSRTIPQEIDRDYFEMVDYSSPSTTTGFTDYTDATTNAGSSFYLYIFSNTTFYTLSDPEYRPLLKLKIALNNSDNTLSYIANILWSFFGGTVVCYDAADMTISYIITPDISNIALIAVQQGLLPKPMGVRISGVFEIPVPLDLWGFQEYTYDTGTLTGFSDYATGFNGDYWLLYQNRIG